jgi:dTDP-4-dehydrorhamnose reductase
LSKLLIIGGSGFVGSTLVSYAKKTYDVHITTNKNKIDLDNIDSTKIDLLKNREQIFNLISDINPDYVVNTVAHSNVDLCETEHKSADLLHIDITKDISNSCKENNSKLVHFSSDFVFNTYSKKRFSENDITNPPNYYGKTRLEAEKIVLDASQDNVVLRTAVIFGWHKKSRFTDWIIKSLQSHKSVDPHNDQYNTPTLVDDLSKAILKIFEHDVSGLYHAAGKTCISRSDFSKELAIGFKLDQKFIKPVSSQVKKQIASRPFCSCLDSSKLEKKINFEFSNIKDAINYIYKKSQE